MRISIEYCVVWNYYPRAAGLAQELENNIEDVQVEFIEGSGGAFEIRDGKSLIFSKTPTFNVSFFLSKRKRSETEKRTIGINVSTKKMPKVK